MALKGIDVSVFQGQPNWQKVKSSGIDFAFIKASQGHSEVSNAYLFKDGSFAYNINSAPKAGISCGVYHYFTAKNEKEVMEEAKFFVDTIKPYKKNITLYAAIDVESKHLDGIGKDELTKFVLQFCDYVRKNGFTPIVYVNPNWLKTRLNGIGNELLWLALWRSKTNVPTGYKNMKVWQWGGSGVNGIKGSVDSNFGYFDIESKNENTKVGSYFQKANSTFSYRKKIAQANGIKNYIGTAAQNTELLNKLKQGKLIKP